MRFTVDEFAQLLPSSTEKWTDGVYFATQAIFSQAATSLNGPDNIIFEERGTCLVVRFSRPEIRNPLSTDGIGEREAAIRDAKRNAYSRIVFTGTENVFASGADLRELARLTPSDAGEFSLRGQSLMSVIAQCVIPSVAAVNGFCFGGGLDLALACRMRIASPNAVFAHPGASLGIITGWGGTQRLPRLIGQARALEMLFTAERVSADQAHRLGLIDLVADDVVEAAVRSQLAPT